MTLRHIIIYALILSVVLVDVFAFLYVRQMPRNLLVAVFIAFMNVQTIYLIRWWMNYPDNSHK